MKVRCQLIYLQMIFEYMVYMGLLLQFIKSAKWIMIVLKYIQINMSNNIGIVNK